jgi:hypothetical protein
MRFVEKMILMLIACLLMLNLVLILNPPEPPTTTIVTMRHAKPKHTLPVSNKSSLPVSNTSSPQFVRLGHLESDADRDFRPLYGKQLGRDTWKYYALVGTQDTGLFPVAVIDKQNRNCLDHNGCRQLYDHDTVHVDQDLTPRAYQVKMYDRMFF